MMDTDARRNILEHFGANTMEVEELLEYNRNIFIETRQSGCRLPETVEDEPFAHVWKTYAAEASEKGAFAVLKKHIVQMNFPVSEGISVSENYRAAVLRGVSHADMPEAAGICLRNPSGLKLCMHRTPAGSIPLLLTRDRDDFKTLVRVFCMKNEPCTIPDSMGACFLKGFNNWDRVARYRSEWKSNAPDNSERDWQEEFKRLIPRKELYQDKLIILSDGPYSGVPAECVGLSGEEWLRCSLIIRREHESTHYFSQRFYGSARNNLLDEIIADYAGIKAAAGTYRSDWMLTFLGLESFPDYRNGARLENYRGKPGLSDGAFLVLQKLVWYAVRNLESFDRKYDGNYDTGDKHIEVLMELYSMTLEEIASL